MDNLLPKDNIKLSVDKQVLEDFKEYIFDTTKLTLEEGIEVAIGFGTHLMQSGDAVDFSKIQDVIVKEEVEFDFVCDHKIYESFMICVKQRGISPTLALTFSLSIVVDIESRSYKYIKTGH